MLSISFAPEYYKIQPDTIDRNKVYSRGCITQVLCISKLAGGDVVSDSELTDFKDINATRRFFRATHLELFISIYAECLNDMDINVSVLDTAAYCEGATSKSLHRGRSYSAVTFHVGIAVATDLTA